MTEEKYIPIEREYIVRQVETIKDAAEKTLYSIHSQFDGLTFIFNAKFNRIGHDPIESWKTDNLMEQINQSITLLTTYWVLYQRINIKRNIKREYFRANLGEKSGTDLEIFKENEEKPEHIFEIFSATDPYRNNKLLKDIKTVASREDGKNRYVCFCSPIPFRTTRKTYEGTKITWERVQQTKDPKEGEYYPCTFQGKKIKIMWITKEFLFDWVKKLK